MSGVRKRIEVRGIVQGVGFRPFVYRIAKRCDVRGWVLNSSDGVVIEAEGGDVGQFLTILRTELPPLARIDRFLITDHAPLGRLDFVIQHSVAVGGRFALVRRCGDLRRLHDRFHLAGESPYGYPFTNCTNCGPATPSFAMFRMTARTPPWWSSHVRALPGGV